MTINEANEVYITGTTRSINFPKTPNVVGDFATSGLSKAFVSKFNAGGSDLIFSTLWGVEGCPSEGKDIELNSNGDIWVTGRIGVLDPSCIDLFPTSADAFDHIDMVGGSQIYTSLLSPSAEKVFFSTLWGGSHSEDHSWIEIQEDACHQKVHLGFLTRSSDIATTPNAVFPTTSGSEHRPYLAKMSIPLLRAGSSAQYLEICKGEEVVLEVSNELGDYQYNWSTGATTPTITVDSAGTYIAEITQMGCPDIVWDTTIISILPGPSLELGRDTILCEGDTITIDITDSLAVFYEWQSNPFQNNPVFHITSPGTYWVEVYGEHCLLTDTIHIEPCEPIGIQTYEVDCSLQLYPNPNNGNFTLESPKTIQELQIFDTSGRLVYQKQSVQKNRLEVELSEVLNVGMYHIRTVTNCGIEQQKIVVY